MTPWTWLARVASLNALGAVAGPDVRVIRCVLGGEALDPRISGGTEGEDGRISVADDVVVGAAA